MKTSYLSPLLLLLALAPAAHAAYKCVDERGLTHIGDTPPPGCANVPMFEITRSGSVIRRIEPTPTPEQLRLRQEEAERKKAADHAAAEQRRKDMALLATFSRETEFDVVRDRNIEPLKGRINSANERIKAIEKRERELEDEMEFYKAGKKKSAKSSEARKSEVPAPMLAEMERLRGEKKTLEGGIAQHEREIVQVRARFDTDKRRWMDLKSGVVKMPDAPAPPPAPEKRPPRAY